MLDALVLAYGPSEHAPLTPVGARPRQSITPKPNSFDADQDALGVEAVEKIAEPLAFFSNTVLDADEQIVDEHRIRIDGPPAHLSNSPDLDLRAVEVSVKQRHSVRRLPSFRARRGAGEQENLVRFERG